MKAIEALATARQRSQLSQRELAERAGTSQSVVARIENGQTTPTIETLERLVNAGGFDLDLALTPRAEIDPIIEAFKKDIDRTLLRRNLEKTPDERLKSLVALVRLAEEAHRAGRKARGAR